jgi:hypothetical protein
MQARNGRNDTGFGQPKSKDTSTGATGFGLITYFFFLLFTRWDLTPAVLLPRLSNIERNLNTSDFGTRVCFSSWLSEKREAAIVDMQQCNRIVTIDVMYTISALLSCGQLVLVLLVSTHL